MHATTTDLAVKLSVLADRLSAARDAILAPQGVVRGVMFDQYTGAESGCSTANQLADAVTDVDMALESENGSVLRFPGLYSVSEEVLHHVRALNTAKSDFEHCVTALKNSGMSAYLLRVAYRRLGYARIHPLQAWRQINILDAEGLESVRFSVAKAVEGVEVLTYAQTLVRLEEVNASDVAEQIRSISGTSKFQWHEPVSRHLRANIVWGSGKNTTKAMKHASMPFLVPADCWPVQPVRFNQPRSHNTRADAIRVHVIDLPHRTGAYISWR